MVIDAKLNIEVGFNYYMNMGGILNPGLIMKELKIFITYTNLFTIIDFY